MRTAYAQGQHLALQKYALHADQLADVLGGFPQAGPVGAGVVAGVGTPDGQVSLERGLRTGVSAAGGQVLGRFGGEGLGTLLAMLAKKDPTTLQQVLGSMGSVTGGMLGSHVGRTGADESAALRQLKTPGY